MNKKYFFLLLFAVFAPSVCFGAGVIPAQLQTTLDNISEVVIAIGYAVVVIGFVIAGILYLTSAGNPGKTETAKKALVAAVIGAIVVAGATGTKVFIQIIGGIVGGH